MTTDLRWNDIKTRDLTISNDLLGDPDALQAAWERDGYWFFRDVLDQGAVTRLRSVYTNVLAGMGLLDPSDPQLFWNKAPLDALPYRMDPLVRLEAWRGFVAEPAIDRFFTALLGDEPFWVPTVEYRAYAPAADRAKDRIDLIHQDSFYNQGIPYLVCWVPLTEVDESVGGLTLAEGMHRHGCLHDTGSPPYCPVPIDAIPDSAWRRSDYRPGDLVMMNYDLPHSGLANHSDRFRLSLDIRVMPSSGKVPFIGKLTAIRADEIELLDTSGRVATFKLDEATYCRGLDGIRVAQDKIHDFLEVGTTWIVASEDGIARVVRPPH